MEKLIFKAIVGSQAYGTSIPTSDIDYKGIYIQHPDSILSFKYNEQIENGKDECYYEIRRFLQLAQSANPTILEMLFSDDKCIVNTSAEFEILRKHRHKFLTKKCRDSFGGYAIAQIKKSSGLQKKMNWEKDRLERKTPLNFVYMYDNGKTIPIEKYLKKEGMKQELCGLVALDHMKDCYSLYYDYAAHYNHLEPLGFRGIEIDDGNSVRVSSVPKGMNAQCIVSYNKDGYSKHCKDFKDYTTWMENRNTARYVDVEKSQQQIDGKNLLHCRRLLDMAIEIAEHKNIKVYRPNADYLLSIRRGEVQLDKIISEAEADIERLDAIYANADLPTTIDMEFVNKLLLEIRHSVDWSSVNFSSANKLEMI